MNWDLALRLRLHESRMACYVCHQPIHNDWTDVSVGPNTDGITHTYRLHEACHDFIASLLGWNVPRWGWMRASEMSEL